MVLRPKAEPLPEPDPPTLTISDAPEMQSVHAPGITAASSLPAFFSHDDALVIILNHLKAVTAMVEAMIAKK